MGGRLEGWLVGDKRMVFRVPDDLASAVDVEAEKAGMSRSEYIRAALESSLLWNWVGRQKQVEVSEAPVGSRQLGMRVIMPRGGCLHPPTAHNVKTK